MAEWTTTACSSATTSDATASASDSRKKRSGSNAGCIERRSRCLRTRIETRAYGPSYGLRVRSTFPPRISSAASVDDYAILPLTRCTVSRARARKPRRGCRSVRRTRERVSRRARSRNTHAGAFDGDRVVGERKVTVVRAICLSVAAGERRVGVQVHLDAVVLAQRPVGGFDYVLEAGGEGVVISPGQSFGAGPRVPRGKRDRATRRLARFPGSYSLGMLSRSSDARLRSQVPIGSGSSLLLISASIGDSHRIGLGGCSTKMPASPGSYLPHDGRARTPYKQ